MLFKIAGALIGVLVLVVIAAVIIGALMWRGVVPAPGPLAMLLGGAGREPEYSARFYPADTLLYGWLTLAPAAGEQQASMDAIWRRFNDYIAFSRRLGELKTDFTSETGIDFDAEIAPWLGPEIGAGVMEGNPVTEGNADSAEAGPEPWDNFRAAITIGVRDQDAAAAFLVKWRDYMAMETGADFTAGEYRGYDTWVDDSAYQAYALADQWLVYATDEATLQDILARIDNGGSDDSLARDADFMAARAALPSVRFNSGYADVHRVTDLLNETFADYYQDEIAAPGLGGLWPTPEWAAASGTWVERGILLEVVSPATTAGAALETPELDNPAELLPDNTLAFAAAGFDPDVDHWRTALAEYPLADVLPYPELLDEINAGLAEMMPDAGLALTDDATLADALDLGFDLALDFTGIDLENDFFGHLAGEAIVAVTEFDFEAIDESPEDNPVPATAMLSYRDGSKDDLQATMDDLAGLIEEYLFFFATLDTVNLNAGATATLFRIAETEYAPGYALHDGWLILGSSEEAIDAIVARQNGAGNALASDAEYRRAVGHLPAPRQALGYVSLQRIIAQVDAEDLEMEPDEYQALSESLGAVSFGAVSAGDYDRGALALTLFPE